MVATTGTNIRIERARRKWSQQTLADRAGVSVKTVSAIERGSDSRLETLQNVAGAFGVPVRDLIAEASPLASQGDSQRAIVGPDDSTQPVHGTVSDMPSPASDAPARPA